MAVTKLTIETIRLLLHVAWADGEVAPEEYDYILRMARNAGMTEEDILSVDRALRDRDVLREPDFAFLKPFRTTVLEHVNSLIVADDKIAAEETNILHKIAVALL